MGTAAFVISRIFGKMRGDEPGCFQVYDISELQ